LIITGRIILQHVLLITILGHGVEVVKSQRVVLVIAAKWWLTTKDALLVGMKDFL